MSNIGLIIVLALIFAIVYSFSYPYIVCLVRQIDEEQQEYDAQEKNSAEISNAEISNAENSDAEKSNADAEGKDEEYSFFYSFVFGDILFDFILFRFVKYIVLMIKKKERVDFDLKKQALLGIWGLAISLGVLGYFGIGLYSVFCCILILILTMITIIDILRMEIPCELNGLIYVLALISIFLFPQISISSRLIGALIISVPMQLIVFAVPGGFGGGDIKLMFAAGLFLGTSATVAAFFIGLILGGVYGIVQLALRKLGRKEHFAFGPFLSAGLIISLFCGNQLVQLYISTMLRR